MAITTLDGLIAGLQPPQDCLKVTGTMEAAGVMHSMFYNTGMPGAAAAPTPGINGAALTTYAGQIPYANPGAGNGYLARVTVSGGVAGTLMVCDRLWHNSGIASATTTAQAITTPTFPARDRDGSTNGVGVMMALEVSVATTNGSAITNTTLNYTDSAGNTGNVATITSFPATAVAGTFVPFQLAAGDLGVRAITAASSGGITLGTSYGTGTVHLVAYRVLAQIPVTVANAAGVADTVSGLLPRMYDNSVPFLLWRASATTATTVQGQITYAHG